MGVEKSEGKRCPSINPKSTGRDQCQRPIGHTGDHVGFCHSGGMKIYPSKWTDGDDAKSLYESAKRIDPWQ